MEAQNKTPGQGLVVIENTLKDKQYQDILRKSLKNPATLDAFTEATIAALRTKPEMFVTCDKQSLYNSILDAARRGILPDGKQGALVSYNTRISKNPDRYVLKAQFLIMPQGIIDAFAKVGITAYSQSVYAMDTIRFWSDDQGQHIQHDYNPFGDRGQRVGAYASGMTRGGRCYVEAMSLDELNRARAASRTPDKGPWIEWPERMEQKSALHRLDKRMPGAGIVGDDGEPQNEVEVPDSADSPCGGTVGSTMPEPPAEQAKVLSDDSKRPRGLQAIIDSDEVLSRPEVERIQAAQALSATQGSVEQTGESPF